MKFKKFSQKIPIFEHFKDSIHEVKGNNVHIVKIDEGKTYSYYVYPKGDNAFVVNNFYDKGELRGNYLEYIDGQWYYMTPQ